MSSGSSEAYITVFKPASHEKNVDGPRIWNDQLLQYAAYADGDSVMGDPKNVRKTRTMRYEYRCTIHGLFTNAAKCSALLFCPAKIY